MSPVFPVFVKKIFRDLLSNRGRTLATILVLALGGFSVGTMTVSMALIRPGMDRGFRETHPADIVLTMPGHADESERASVDAVIHSTPGVSQVESRPRLTGRIRLHGGEWKTLVLFLLQDPSTTLIDRITPESGNLVQDASGEAVVGIERAALKFLGAQEGESVDIRVPGVVDAFCPR